MVPAEPTWKLRNQGPELLLLRHEVGQLPLVWLEAEAQGGSPGRWVLHRIGGEETSPWALSGMQACVHGKASSATLDLIKDAVRTRRGEAGPELLGVIRAVCPSVCPSSVPDLVLES